MFDLKFHYTDENGKGMSVAYNTIMDFIDMMEDGDTSVINGTDVDAVFFNNPLNTKHCATVKELLEHCKMIVQ